MIRSALLAPLLLVTFAVGLLHADDTWTADDMVRTDSKGRLIVQAKPVDERLRNPWPSDLEEGFRDRADAVLKAQAQIGASANTYFENEKRNYGYLMAHALMDGKRAEALKILQGEDAQAGSWHKHTKGIDYYAAFTIKHQMRKYFYYGDLLDPAYRKRMYEGAKIWTEKDPHRRPHHAHKPGTQGWGPDGKNSWVDVRGTENLALMRVTSVYLMAEETGNEETRLAYKQWIARYVASLYRIGMGEWDSENYHGHSITPVHNLYDFAKDEEVKLLAKAALDWLYAAGAVKYYRGGFNGPTKRDYNHVQPFGGSAASAMWLYLGDTPAIPSHWESDEIHQITSAYRPPVAVVNLGRKQFDKPREILATKADYSAPQQGDWQRPPAFLETHYFGHTFQMGSLASGTSTGAGDVSGFKIMAYSKDRGVLDIQAAPTGDPNFVGSPRYAQDKVTHANRVGQYRNVAVWLAKGGDAPWVWVLPKEVSVEQHAGLTFLKGDRTWFAIHPVAISIPAVDPDLTERINFNFDKDGKKKGDKWPDHQVLAARGQGGSYCGFVIEIGEAQTHGDYNAFRKAVADKARVDASALADGIVSYVAADGKTLKVQFADKPTDLGVWRDGEQHDWTEHAKWTYREVGKGDGLIQQPWVGDGTLRIEADGQVFTCTVSEDGKVTFENKKQ